MVKIIDLTATSIILIAIQLELCKSCFSKDSYSSRSNNLKTPQKDNEKYKLYMNDERMIGEKAKCEAWIKKHNNRYHPYYNPDPSRNNQKIRKEPILANIKEPNPNDPMEKYSKEMFNLDQRAGIGFPLIDFCILKLIDQSKKFEKNYTYIPSSFAEDIFINPDINFPESFEKLKFKGRIILAAVAIDNSKHWAAMKADTDKKIMEWYNSGDPTLSRQVFKEEALAHLGQFQKILRRRNQEIPDDYVDPNEWIVTAPTYKTKRQNDEFNCGTYVMMFIDKVLHDGKLSIIGNDVFEYRNELKQRLVDTMIVKSTEKQIKKKKN